MTQSEITTLTMLRNSGWNFNHLSGSKMSADNQNKCFIVDCSTSDEGYKKLFQLIREEVAYSITNQVGVSDYYDAVYQAAYQVLYKGKLTNKSASEVAKLQSEDVRKNNYVPADILSRLKIAIAVC